jgi:hypothetical protein
MTFAIVRLGREWQLEEVRRFVSELMRHRVFVDEPVVNTALNPTELVFRCSEYEFEIVRSKCEEVAPLYSRPTTDFIAAKNIELAMNPSFRQHI